MALNMSSINLSFSRDTLSQFSLADFSMADFLVGVKPLIFFVIGMTVYSIFIFKFYKFLARRDIIQFKTRYYERYEGFLHHVGRLIFYMVENLLVIPVLVFFWFAVLATLILMLSKSNDINMILLSSASIVGAVRVTSYYNENLSQDLAKMIPFALLGVFIIDVRYFSFDSAISVLTQLPELFQYLVYYLLFVILLEFILRIFFSAASVFIRSEANPEEED